jgi:hypothetical protein
MRQLPIEQQFLLIVEIGALLVLCVRLYFNGLYRIYPYFFGYLVLEFLQMQIPLLVPLDTRLYRDLFVVSQGLIVAFYALVVLELYSKFFHELTGIASLARRYIRWALVLAAILALIPMRLEKEAASVTGYLFSYERTVMSILVVFILLITGFLAYYPVPLARNVVFYLAGYAVYFLTDTIVALAQNMGYFWNRMLGSVDMAVFVGCLILWVATLNRQGESRQVAALALGNPGVVLSQLEALNAVLSRSRK